MAVFFGILIVAAVIACPIIADVWASRARPRVVENVKPPAAVNAFMGREPDSSLWGYALWATPEGDLAWCPYVRPAAPVDNPGDGA